jgi:Uri superfamily endonuclease
MSVKIDDKHTLYHIKIYLPEDREITVGKLGTFIFPKGVYVYVGSDRRNIRARVERHIRPKKKQRWHFDYIRPYMKVMDVQTYPGEEGECGLFARLRKEAGGEILVHRFGSSDCRCPAHLFFIRHTNSPVE